MENFSGATNSYAALSGCGGGLGPFGIICEHGRGQLRLQFARVSDHVPGTEGSVDIVVGVETFTVPGSHYDLHGTAMFEAYVERDHSLLDALQRGADFTIVENGNSRNFHLSGSARAIEVMELACR